MGVFSSIGSRMGGMVGGARAYGSRAMGMAGRGLRSADMYAGNVLGRKGMMGGAARGAVAGLGGSMLGGMMMGGDQSQLGGMGFGAGAGALLGSRYGRRGLASMGRSKAFRASRFGNTAARRSLGVGMVAGGAAGTAGLIGSTMLESNSRY